MAKTKSNNFLDEILTLGALVGGAWLSVEILKSLTRVYKCPNCKQDIKKADVAKCPHCGVPLEWK